ncbi:MAG: HAD-IIA family hydrolase [Aerococcus sp.]|nr:HAD-IIA family hydrolase [Aerococcus sp.]
MTALLIDLDGTIYRGDARIPGAAEFIRQLQDERTPFLFVTNNAARSPEVVQEALAQQHDIHVSADTIYTSVDAALYTAKGILAKRQKSANDTEVFLVGSDYLNDTLVDAGMTVHRKQTTQSEDFVVVGMDFNSSYQTLSQAGLALQSGATYLLTNPDLQLPSAEGFLPGNGAIGQLLKTTSGVDFINCGKPSRRFIQGALDRLGITADDAMILGDSLRTDIQAGINSGIETIMIETGVNTRQDIDSLGINPDVVVEDYQTLSKWWQQR